MTIKKQKPSRTLDNGKQAVSMVVFMLEKEAHAVRMADIREIIQHPKLSPVAEAPEFVEGVIKYRGRVTPVINLKRRMQIPDDGKRGDMNVMIVQHNNRPAGLLVDAISDIVKIAPQTIEAPSDMLDSVNKRFVDGHFFVSDRFHVVLNMEEILSVESAHVDPYGGIVDESEDTAGDDDTDLHGPLRRLITFTLDGELYGVDIENVAEIMPPVPVIPLPNVPDFFLGLINLRNTIVPLIDLRPLFSLSNRSCNKGSGVVVATHKAFMVGITVDRVEALIRLPPAIFQETPADDERIDSTYLTHVCMTENRMLIVLDIKRILLDTEKMLRSDKMHNLKRISVQ